MSFLLFLSYVLFKGLLVFGGNILINFNISSDISLFDINSAILDISQNFRNTEVVIGVAITWVNHK